MLKHTKKIREIYEDIQKKLFYMIPEKWDKLYLYSSILDKPDEDGKTGELFFYYFPKGIFKKKAINVYEIPSRFNVDEAQYLKLVEILYSEIKMLREEIKKVNPDGIWSNLTMIIEDSKFRVEYDYKNLNNYEYNSFERHIIWRYEYLGIGPEKLNKAEREILKKYITGAKVLSRKEHYDSGIYIRDIENMVAYSTNNYDTYSDNNDTNTKRIEEHKRENDSKKNQILFSNNDED